VPLRLLVSRSLSAALKSFRANQRSGRAGSWKKNMYQLLRT
jgi:hypothetical protein